jgi:uncharacterized damage-inducible protein DinB
MDLLDRMLDYERWATHQLLKLSHGLTDTQLDQEFDIGHRTLRKTFDHIIQNTWGWTSVMAQEYIDAGPEGATPDALTARFDTVFGRFADFARGIRDEGRIDELFTDHFNEQQSFGGAILHVLLHNTEHRSEVLHIYNRVGLPEVPEIDHALWDHVRRGAVL